jgi:DNA-binding transcriptional LysR family regulator
MELARSKIDRIHSLITGTIRFAIIEATAQTWLFPIINKFTKEYPGVKFEGRIVGSESVYEALNADQVDFGIAMEIALPSGIDIIERIDTKLQAVMSPDHPLAQYEALALEDIAPHVLIMLNAHYLTRKLINSASRQRGIELNIVFELDNIELIKQFVLSSKGLTILPSYSVGTEEIDGQRLITTDIIEENIQRCSTILCVRQERNLTHAANTFVHYLRHYMRVPDVQVN